MRKMSELMINEDFNELRDENNRLLNELTFERNLNNILENIRNNSLILIEKCKCLSNKNVVKVIKQFNTIYTDLKTKQSLLKRDDKNDINHSNNDYHKNHFNFDHNFKKIGQTVQQKSGKTNKMSDKSGVKEEKIEILSDNCDLKTKSKDIKANNSSKFSLISEMLNLNNQSVESVDNSSNISSFNSSEVFENSNSNAIEFIECEPNFESILDDDHKEEEEDMEFTIEEISSNSNFETGPFECRVCKTSFEQKTRLQNHLVKVHKIPGFECDLCDYKTVSKYHLNRHKACHSSEKPFKCTIDGCDKWFKTKDYLYEHKKLIHTIEKRFKCDLCDYKTNCKTNLTHHLSRHSTDRPYMCPILGCNKTFKSKKSLKTHKSPTHPSFQTIQLYECNSCDFITNSKPKLSLHQNIHSVDKQFECQLCHEWFNTELSLDDHKLQNHPNKHYFCDFPDCGKSFSSNQYLKVHKNNTHFSFNIT